MTCARPPTSAWLRPVRTSNETSAACPPLPEIAAAARLSPYHFQRVFLQTYGQTPKQVVTALQVAEAQRLIVRGTPLEKAAKSVGFSHQSHMTARFKRIVGTTPGRWARESRKIPR